jgi:hypothetical protein
LDFEPDAVPEREGLGFLLWLDDGVFVLVVVFVFDALAALV